MSLLKHDVIDFVAVLPYTNYVTLFAYDVDEFATATDRQDALQDKLVTYLRFVVSGQFVRAYPDFSDKEVRVVVVCEQPPTNGMTKIEGIRDHQHPETFIPVKVLTVTEFRTRLQARNL